MARPTNANPERTRQRLLDASAVHFTQNGLEGTSLRTIAKSAGVSLATIHHYFGNKDGLYTACRARLYNDLQAELVPMAAKLEELAGRVGDVAIADVLDELVREGFRFARAQQPSLRLLMRTLLDTGELDPAWRNGFLIPFLHRSAALISQPLGRSEADLYPMLQALIAMGMRFALSSEGELSSLTGAAQGVDAMENQLVLVAKRLLLESPHV